MAKRLYLESLFCIFAIYIFTLCNSAGIEKFEAKYFEDFNLNYC